MLPPMRFSAADGLAIIEEFAVADCRSVMGTEGFASTKRFSVTDEISAAKETAAVDGKIRW